MVACAGGHWAKGICRLQELNRNPVGRLGYLEEYVEAGWGSRWRAGRHAQVVENLDDDRGIFNGCEDGQGAVALWTGGDIDGEDAFE